MTKTQSLAPLAQPDRAAALRRRLLTSGAVAACALALLLRPGVATAQSTAPSGAYEGTPTVVTPGSATITRGFNQDFITINGREAIINWTPYDRGDAGAIDFLPGGRSAFYSGLVDFTVLNRIIPLNGQDIPVARLIQLNGQIFSSVGDPANQSFGPGGNIWFYSPGGILVGGGAVINVGSLVLSTRDIDTSGGLFGPNGEMRFRNPGITGSDASAITIDPTATITATQANSGSSYVALVAPRIVQQGTINSDGSVALVAAEEADIRINQGLFDINVTVGTGDGNGIVHSGATGGPAETANGYSSRVYMVAVPKNQALTMLLSGTVGFETATTASVTANGGIVLSAGRNILNGQADTAAPTGTAASAGMVISGGRFINDVTGAATGDIRVEPTGGAVDFERNLTLNGDRSVTINAGNGQTINVAGDMLLGSRPGANGGLIDIAATDGGSITIGGLLSADATGNGDGTTDGVARGGTVNLSAANRGSVSASSVDLSANAFGGVAATGVGGAATGGVVNVNLTSGGTLNTDFLSANANGFGGGTNGTLTGGNGTGGRIRLTIAGTTLAIGGMNISASGIGGFGADVAGNGLGGLVSLEVSTGGIINAGDVFLYADGDGGSANFDSGRLGRLGGDGTGGNVTVALGSALDQRFGTLQLSAEGRGGLADTDVAGLSQRGGNGFGGSVGLSHSAGALTIDTLSLSSNARGGETVRPDGTGGNARGGVSTLDLTSSGIFTVNDALFVTADAFGGFGRIQSGNGIGGRAFVDAGLGTTGNIVSVTVTANGRGAGNEGPPPSIGSETLIGGNGLGGAARIASSGTFTANNITLQANGHGGGAYSPTAAAVGGRGSGGTAELRVLAASLGAASLAVAANGIGGSSGTATGIAGTGEGGLLTVSVNALSSLDVTGSTSISATGTVDDSGAGANRGASGGRITLDVRDGGSFTSAGDMRIDASAEASNLGPVVRESGQFKGGTITINASSGGTISAATLYALANGTASHSTGIGGIGQGGDISLNLIGGSLTTTATSLSQVTLALRAAGTGGDGSFGGNGRGGQVQLVLSDGSINDSQTIDISADGTAGGSTNRASTTNAIGGTVGINLQGAPGTQLNFNNLFVHASAIGNFAGGFGGDAFGGSVTYINNGGTMAGALLSISASGEGGIGADGQGGSVNFTTNGGENRIDFTSISANGTGGFSELGSDGGDGTGGVVSLNFNGGLLVGQNFFAEASGSGGRGGRSFLGASGNSAAGNGGDGRGGQILAQTNSGVSIELGQLYLDAAAFGGAGGAHDISLTGGALIGAGGDAFGGTIDFTAFGGSMNGTQSFLSATARGGLGGQLFNSGSGTPVVPTGPDSDGVGGDAVGGQATVRLYSTVGGTYSINSSATAGEGGSGFSGHRGGDAIGGLSQLIVEDFDAGQIDVELLSTGHGGRGGRAAQGAGGDGGTGTGGFARLLVNGPNGFATVLDTGFNVRGIGGNGGHAEQFEGTERGFDGGDGGTGIGGTIEFIAHNGGGIAIAATGAEGELFAHGTAGDGGNGSNNDFGPSDVPTFGGNGGFGGFGQGGNIILTADGGTITTTTANSFMNFVAEGFDGNGGFGGAGTATVTFDPVTGDPIVNGGNGFDAFGGFGTAGGLVQFNANSLNGLNGLINLPTTSISVNGIFAGRIALFDQAAGAGIRFQSLNASARGAAFGGGPDFRLGGSGIYIESLDGSIEILTSARFTTSSDPGGNAGQFFLRAISNPTFASSGGLRVGSAFVFNGSGIGGTHDGNPDIDQADATLQAASITINSVGPGIAFDTTTLLLATNRITLNAGQTGLQTTVSFGGLRSQGRIDISGSSIVGSQARSVSNFDSTSTGGTSIGFIDAGSIDMHAGSSLTVNSFTTTTGDAGFVAGGDLILDQGTAALALFGTSTGGNIRLGTLTSTGNATFDAAGTITINSLATLLTSSAAGSIFVTSGGALNLGTLNSSAGIQIRSATVGGAESVLSAGGLIDIVTGGALVIGSADAGSISFSSGGNLQFSGITSGGAVLLNSSAAIVGGSLSTINGDASLTATGGDIQLETADVGGAFTVNASRDVTLGQFISDFDADITAGRNANVTSGVTEGPPGNNSTSAPGNPVGQAGGATTSNILFNVGGTLALGSLDSLGSIRIRAATLTGATSSLAANTSIDIGTSGTAAFGTLDAGTAVIVAGDVLSFSRATTSGNTSLTALGITGTDLVSTGGGLTVVAGSGGIRLTTVRAQTAAALNSVGGILLGTLDISDGDALIKGDGDVSLDAATVNYLLDLHAGGNATLGTVRAGTVQGQAGAAFTASSVTTNGFAQSTQNLLGARGDIRLSAGSSLSLGTLNAAASIILRGSTLTGSSSSLTAVEGVDILTSGAATLGSIDAAKATISSGPLTFARITTSGNSDISATGAVTGNLLETTGASAIINASGTAMTLAQVNAAGDARLSATNGTLSVTALASAGRVSASGGTVTIGGSSNLDFSSLTATSGNATVNLSSGALRVRSGNAAGSLSLTTTGSMVVDAATAASIGLNAGTSISLIGPVTATGDLTISATGNVGINGVASGGTVRVASGNISIGSGGRLGTGGTTTLVDLTNSDTTSRTFIGGDDTTSGYSLSAAEMLRIFGNNITIHAPRAQTQSGGSLGSTRPPDLVIGAFTLSGGAGSTGNLGSSGTLTIETPGAARVVGSVQLNGMTSTNRFLLSADQAIEVILGQGSIRLSNGSSRSGVLALESDDIVVATSAAIADIAAASTTDAIDSRLALNDGIISDEGALSAGELRLSVFGGLYIQNSGTSDRFADRRGFTADRVSIETESGSNRIIINGRVADATGLLRTGLDSISLVQINGLPATDHTATGGGFDPDSTINGCTIVRAASCSVNLVLPPIQDIVDEVVEDENSDNGGATGESSGANVLISIRGVEGLPNEPLIDDPVTGTGNDDLWTAPDQ